MNSLLHWRSVLAEAWLDWLEDNAARMGAALAFYSVLSLAPLLLIALALAELIFDQGAARDQLVNQMTGLIGREGGDATRQMLENGTKSGGTAATLLGMVTLLFGASGVFGELQSAIDAVWDVKPKAAGIFEILRARFLSFAMVLGTGFLLVVSLLMSSAIAAFDDSARGAWPQFEFLWHALSLAVTFTIVTILFALIYKLLPDKPVPWRHVWAGALLTAALFIVGKFAIALYLGKSGLASGYGAAGSLVVLIVWVYYSSQILLFGAEITHVISQRETDKPKPQGHTAPADTALVKLPGTTLLAMSYGGAVAARPDCGPKVLAAGAEPARSAQRDFES